MCIKPAKNRGELWKIKQFPECFFPLDGDKKFSQDCLSTQKGEKLRSGNK